METKRIKLAGAGAGPVVGPGGEELQAGELKPPGEEDDPDSNTQVIILSVYMLQYFCPRD